MTKEDKILSALVRVSSDVGEIRGEVSGIRGQLKTVSQQVEIVRQGFEEQGKAIGALQQNDVHRKKQISNLYQAVGKVEEVTQKTEISAIERSAKDKARQELWGKAGKWAWFGLRLFLAILAVAGVGGGILAIFNDVLK